MYIKNMIYNIIRDDDENGLVSNIFDGIIISLIIVNVVLVIADTFDLPVFLKKTSNIIEVISVIIFTIEYVLRVYTSDFIYENLSPFKARMKYIFSFMSVVDLLAILPFYIPFLIPIDLRILRMLRIIKLFRIFKLNRYTSALSSIGSVLKKNKSQLLSSIFVVVILMIIASVLMYNIENEAQPEAFSNAFSALWWAIATVTTVGYGDVYPITILGKILSTIIAFLGIALVAVPTGIISAGFMEDIYNSKEAEDADKVYCPYCGKKIK